MILFHKNFKVNPNDINFKQSRQCSKDFTFVPIQYNQKDFIIQTPLCFIPFGLKKYSTTSTKTYLDITFQEKHEELIQDCLKHPVFQSLEDIESSSQLLARILYRILFQP